MKAPEVRKDIRKFLFEVSFDDEGNGPPEAADEAAEEEVEPEPAEPTFSADDLAAARAEGIKQGHAQGVAEAAEATETRIAGLLEELRAQLGPIAARLTDHQSGMTRDALSVAHGICHKLFPALNRLGGLDEVERSIVEIMDSLFEEPKLEVAVSETDLEPLRQRLAARGIAETGKHMVVLMANPAIAAGNCRIEWGGGSAERSTDDLWRHIDDIVERNIAFDAGTSGGQTDRRAPKPAPETAPATGNPDVAAGIAQPPSGGGTTNTEPVVDFGGESPQAEEAPPVEA